MDPLDTLLDLPHLAIKDLVHQLIDEAEACWETADTDHLDLPGGFGHVADLLRVITDEQAESRDFLQAESLAHLYSNAAAGGTHERLNVACWLARQLVSAVLNGSGTAPHLWQWSSVCSAIDDAAKLRNETPVVYAARYVAQVTPGCDTTDPRLPVLAESYLQSGLHTTLLDAANEATQQLARIDDLTDLNRT